MKIDEIKTDFPILRRKVNGKRLVYLDNAATSQKPKQVIKAISDYYKNYNANVHRGLHTLSEEATTAYEEVRKKIAELINAKSEREIIFTSGTTMALNLVAYSWGRKNLKKDDVVLLSEAEHHSNIVPWKMLQREVGFTIEYLEFNEEGKLELATGNWQLTTNTKLVSLTHVSNTLGTVNDVEWIAREVKRKNKDILICLDGAQAVPHRKVDVQKLGCDFYSFSAHKMLGPSGVGVLWVKEEVLAEMEPFLGGGEMIKEVHLDKSTVYNDYPHKFEAGTPNIAGVIGLGAAVDYLNKIGIETVARHEQELINYTIKKLTTIEGLEILGPKDPKERGGLVSFTLEGIHAHDLATILDEEGIAVRSGHHCAMPLHTKLEIPASTRASIYLYNTEKDIDTLIEGIEKAKSLFRS